MTGWANRGILILGLASMLGCQPTRPSLVPEKTEERLVEPPADSRYDKVGFPKEAFEQTGDPYSLHDAPKAFVPGSNIGTRSNGGTGPYKF